MRPSPTNPMFLRVLRDMCHTTRPILAGPPRFVQPEFKSFPVQCRSWKFYQFFIRQPTISARLLVKPRYRNNFVCSDFPELPSRGAEHHSLHGLISAETH